MEDTYLKNLNEVYLGKGPIVPMQQQFSILRSKIKNIKVTSTTNLDPEILKFNRIVEKTFGFYKFSLYIQPNELPNVYTFTADYFFTDEQKAKIKKELIASPTGFSYEKVFPGVSIVVAINSCVIYDDQYTDEEIIGALLHEIGHGFFEVIMDEDNVYIPSTNSLRIINTILGLMKDKIKNRSNVSAESVSKELNKFGKLFSSVKGIFKKKIKSMFFREALGDNMTKRMIPYTNEKFADTFAAMYGYSNEVHQFLDKVRKYVYDLAYGVRKYPRIIEIMKAYKMYLGDFMTYILGLQDEHPEGLTRIKTAIDYLKRELQRDTIDPAMKREILEQINFLNHLIEEFMNFPKDEDSMRIVRLYSIMLYKKFGGDRREKDADNDAIFDQLDKRYRDSLKKGE